MIEQLGGITNKDALLNSIERVSYPVQTAASGETSRDEKAKQEFMTVFYKEILKQVFKTPNFSIGGEEDKSAFGTSISTFYSDTIVEQLAKEWVAKGYIPIDMLGTNR